MSIFIEDALLKRAQDGDSVALNALYTIFHGSVSRFVWRLAGPDPNGDDIIQDTFLAMYTHLDRVTSGQHFGPFLFRVARNLCYDALRRRKHTSHTSCGFLANDYTFCAYPEQPDNTANPVDETVHWRLLYVRVRQAMSDLPEAQRVALKLYAEHDLSCSQIAEIMSTDVGTVKSRMHYGRKKLIHRLPPDILEAVGIQNREKIDAAA